MHFIGKVNKAYVSYTLIRFPFGSFWNGGTELVVV